MSYGRKTFVSSARRVEIWSCCMGSVVGSICCVVSSLKLGWVGECFVFPAFILRACPLFFYTWHFCSSGLAAIWKALFSSLNNFVWATTAVEPYLSLTYNETWKQNSAEQISCLMVWLFLRIKPLVVYCFDKETLKYGKEYNSLLHLAPQTLKFSR